MKDYARGPNKWQGDRPHGDSRGGPPRRSFGGGGGGGGGGDRSWGPPRRSFGQDGDRGGWQERPRRSFGGPPGGERNDFDRPPRRTFRRPEESPGRSEGGERADSLVQPRALARGLGEARQALAEVVDALASERAGTMEVETVEAPVSFAADGRFLGFGRGGAATMVVTLTALDAEDALEAPTAGHDHGDDSHASITGDDLDGDEGDHQARIGDQLQQDEEPLPAMEAAGDDAGEVDLEGAAPAAAAEPEPVAAAPKRRKASGDKNGKGTTSRPKSRSKKPRAAADGQASS